uniref:Uncharacterized protein n=1 Tax=Oryza barthii TaxID=65489 RepID=A0A0D3HVF7_9ORYZ
MVTGDSVHSWWRRRPIKEDGRSFLSPIPQTEGRPHAEMQTTTETKLLHTAGLNVFLQLLQHSNLNSAPRNVICSAADNLVATSLQYEFVSTYIPKMLCFHF